MENEINVGEIIKTIRIEKGMLLKDVAELCDISSSMLSQIEKGNANPSLNTLKTIASVLGVPLFQFFMEQEKDKNQIKILKEKDRKKITFKDVIYELLSPNIETNIECIKMRLLKKESETSKNPLGHKGEEIAFVSQGKVLITIDNQSKEMEVGDSIHISPLVPHKWTNLSEGESIVIFSVTPPEF